MSRIRAILLVAEREVRERARTRSFLLSTGLLAAIAFAVVAATTF